MYLINKFIVNDRYNTSLIVNGNITINSNLIVLGDNTTLETTIYRTERLEIVNANNTASALILQQQDNLTDIFIASNIDTKVFSISTNGDINITGTYQINNRNVIEDTSNYVLETSNLLVAKADFNDLNASNYVFETSNILSNRLYDQEMLTSNVVNNNMSSFLYRN